MHIVLVYRYYDDGIVYYNLTFCTRKSLMTDLGLTIILVIKAEIILNKSYTWCFARKKWQYCQKSVRDVKLPILLEDKTNRALVNILESTSAYMVIQVILQGTNESIQKCIWLVIRVHYDIIIACNSIKWFYFSKSNIVVGDISIFVMAQRLVPMSFTLAPSR